MYCSSPINENARPKIIKRYSSHSANRPTLSQTYDMITKFKPCNYRAQKITRLITEIICLDMQPFLCILFHQEYLNEMYAELSKCVTDELSTV
ncbi:hypothetical protein PR048_015331 [Dryococelus australis]|uniref:Uncharacterized protein n=1 Tax=Dryococelus australis TaxID=614101 RepID=A0ABQ9HGP1_9NEOP|nr:hypothetical protein PR048_015331 [Dryococelus australis]